ncbi:rho GTPase-activating protein 7 isoform X2 [Frankliniella occidentalis]|uniref:Rho GTPase-activating protein 7 isoform X2 n=1 Tax=Frankliniella occidentalis TaxID=133901 RepID=A0A9C6U320_FRAOC|nr:rho GTPase-activating protein 7 isoform X2 [Frankliniella occidentalis]
MCCLCDEAALCASEMGLQPVWVPGRLHWKDLQFPVDVAAVAKDHPFLEQDSLQSLFRRLHALNRTANMKVDMQGQGDDSDEDDQCALSENWTFQPESRRWSRVCDVSAEHAERLQALSVQAVQQQQDGRDADGGSDGGAPETPPQVQKVPKPTQQLLQVPGAHPEPPPSPGSSSRVGTLEPLAVEPVEGGDGDVVISAVRFGSLPLAGIGGHGLPTESDLLAVRFRRSGSERLRDGAKALLRRMESLKTRRRKRQHREGVVIGSPQVLDVATMQQRMRDLNCVDVSPTEQTSPSPFPPPSSPGGRGTPSPSPDHGSATSGSGGSQGSLTRPSRFTRATRRLLSRDNTDPGTASLSDSECQPTAAASWRQCYLKDANSNNTKVLDVLVAGTAGAACTTATAPDAGAAEEATTRKRTASERGSQSLLGSRPQGSHTRTASLRDREGQRYKVQPGFRRGISVESGHTVHPTPPSSLVPPSPARTSIVPSTPLGSAPLLDEVMRVSTYDNVPPASSSSPGCSPTSPSHAAQAQQALQHTNLHAHSRLSYSACPTPDRSPQDIWMATSELSASHDSNSTLASQPDSEREDSEGNTTKHRGTVVRWHSFQRGSSGRPDSLGPIGPSPGRVSVSALSCGQLLVLRKLALLRLTACMERYCPTHRTGWNWELPKFIRKIKAPDYKDKTVFGVPLLLSLQRCGQALPPAIQKALRWLRANALDQVGLFRKSGVRSRIQRLKTAVETQGEAVLYDGQQAYDVADMVKQFFRELPEALLTNKLSETFISIFQHVPQGQRAEAVSCVLLLLPDEHREALRALLEFLAAVTTRADVNQMSASNLAVCLAPSLLRLHHHSPTSSSPSSPAGRSTSASPRRRNKSIGAPDPRELSENRAAHDCVLHLIRCHRDLFSITEETLVQCHFTYMEESVPVALEELGSELNQDWRGYLYACVNALLREARDRSRGWVTVSGGPEPSVDVAYRKVGDGHPLRLWRVSTEVEAPPGELLQRVLRERHSWDQSLLKWRVVARLSEQTEVFQYVCADMPPLPNRDYCVVRSWRSDLPKGACVVVETSVEHSNAPLLPGGVRGIVLASRYLIEPCGSGKSRIMHLSRVDTKGRTPEWYNKSYGHLCAQHLARIRASFRHNAEGPESKV